MKVTLKFVTAFNKRTVTCPAMPEFIFEQSNTAPVTSAYQEFADWFEEKFGATLSVSTSEQVTYMDVEYKVIGD